jgi:hypothetical protein
MDWINFIEAPYVYRGANSSIRRFRPVGGQYSQYFTLSYELSSFLRFYTHAAMISV